MPNARGEITTSELRQMRSLARAGVSQRRIAEIIGVNRSTVEQYAGLIGMSSRAHRYAAFVERAAPYVPLLVSPSPF